LIIFAIIILDLFIKEAKIVRIEACKVALAMLPEFRKVYTHFSLDYHLIVEVS
jgi:hypothetical protein